MNRRFGEDDPELRELLDSLGIPAEYSVPTKLTEDEVRRADEMLATVMSSPRGSGAGSARDAQSRRIGWTGGSMWGRVAVALVVCALAGVLLLVQPWGGVRPAVAQTPAMLHFASVSVGEIPTVGDPAAEVWRDLALRAATLPAPMDSPVQRVEVDAWWASSGIPENEAEVQSVLVPVRSVAYLLPTGERRSIEYRGEPLDADGRPMSTDMDWDTAPPLSDTIVAIDHAMGAGYPESLPVNQDDLIEELAPSEVCGETRGGCLLSAIAMLFETYVVPPALTARIWDASANESSITTLGQTVDRLGREAVALTAAGLNPSEQVLILIDPHNGRYLGSETILIQADESFGFDPPAVISFTAVVTAERVPESDVPDDTTATRY